jgi:hypothetical protein
MERIACILFDRFVHIQVNTIVFYEALINIAHANDTYYTENQKIILPIPFLSSPVHYFPDLRAGVGLLAGSVPGSLADCGRSSQKIKDTAHYQARSDFH